MINIVIKGRIPSKKNCKMALPIRGRCMVINSTAYTKWQRETSNQLIGKVPMDPIKSCFVYMTFFAPDKRRTDLTNKAESIMDLLVENGVIEDDNADVVSKIYLDYGGVDRKNPRMEIQIK